MPKKPNPYLDFLLEQLSPLGEITFKAMFGGYCVYCDGLVFGLIADNELWLKADDHNRAMFVDRGLKPFQPFPNKDEVMSYYPAPAEIFEDPDAMERWCRPAISASARKKKPAKAAASRSRP